MTDHSSAATGPASTAGGHWPSSCPSSAAQSAEASGNAAEAAAEHLVPSSTSPVPPGLALDDQLCFALYTASRAVTAAYRPLLDGLGLTYPQYLVMLVLWERGSVPVKGLGSALHLDYGTLSPLLKRLEAGGLVRRERRSDDERSVLITLTPRGQGLRRDAECVPSSMGRAFGLTGEEVADLRARLLSIAARMG